MTTTRSANQTLEWQFSLSSKSHVTITLTNPKTIDSDDVDTFAAFLDIAKRSLANISRHNPVGSNPLRETNP